MMTSSSGLATRGGSIVTSGEGIVVLVVENDDNDSNLRLRVGVVVVVVVKDTDDTFHVSGEETVRDDRRPRILLVHPKE